MDKTTQPAGLRKYRLLEPFEFFETPRRRYYSVSLTDADVEQLREQQPDIYAKYFRPVKEGATN